MAGVELDNNLFACKFSLGLNFYNMIDLIRTNSKNQDFINLVKQLDIYLKFCEDPDHSFYDQFNKVDNLNHVVFAYINNIALGCGAFKIHADNIVEIKRMYVSSDGRRKEIASKVLTKLENWAKELNIRKSILETGQQ